MDITKDTPSLLDTDLYKLTMEQAVIQHYPRAEAQYDLIFRRPASVPPGFVAALRDQIKCMDMRQLTPGEAQFLRTIKFLTPPYIDFLAGYRFNPDEVSLVENHDGTFGLRIIGPWYRTILWEVPLMALISEMYFKWTRNTNIPLPLSDQEDLLRAKRQQFGDSGARIADFGTRRRYSYDTQAWVVSRLQCLPTFNGTSNVHLAHVLGCRPIGTMAHEWIQFHGAKYGYRNATSVALGRWVDVFHGSLGIALPDTFTSEVFFRSFDLLYAKLFDGVRQDSGDPLTFFDAAVAHYRALGIDPASKTVVFSDGLTARDVVSIQDEVQKRVPGMRVSYGIGTHLTNDVGVTPLNMVIKMTACRPDGVGPWLPCVKLSDSPGKYTGDPDAVRQAKQELGLS